MPTVVFKSPFSHDQGFCCCRRGESLACEHVSTVRDGVGCDQKEFQMSQNNRFEQCSCFLRALAMQTAMWRYGLGYELPACQQLQGS